MPDIYSPIARYIGGKYRLRDIIARHLAGIINYRLYVEPFCGGSSIFYNINPSSKKRYILNDTNDLLITFYKVAKSDSAAFIDYCTARGIYSQSLHGAARDIINNNKQCKDIEIAWAVWYNTITAFAGEYNKTYGRDVAGKINQGQRMHNKIAILPAQLDILQLAEIENNDFLTCINRYDNADVAFYIDPPYIGTHCKLYPAFTESDYIALLNAISNIKGKFVMSCYQSQIIDTYIRQNKWYNKEYKAHCTISNKTRNSARTELVVQNFKSKESLL